MNTPLRSVDSPQARNRELAQIHIAVAELGWTEDDYRAILQAKTGKRSAGELDSTGRKRFLEHLKACGWSGHKKPQLPKYSKQQWHVRMLWKDLAKAGKVEDASEAALNSFIQHLVGVSDLRFLSSTGDATKVIEALKAWLRRGKR